ncbi:hypothetical protein [Bradyrhizobium erythrophlei]|uniref:Uncharacterized protein n=1 Tax=Bradyrhizobium erythrophlei TaxID=1437360 RepID=A0A1M7ULQ8_9BRAD|nr:hypothetical protein SAMN05444170_5670 [Bradyrhizobium erythrophlei]
MRAFVTLAVLIGTASMACAESNGPVIAIPGRPGVPVIINGVDASYAVVEGDWGLDKGVHYQPTVYGGHPIEPMPPVGHYYPSSGRLPGYGRLEIEGPDKPKPAPSFHESWSAGSRQADPLIPSIQNSVPQYPPPVIVAPQINERNRGRRFEQNSAIPQQNAAPLISASPQQNPPVPQPEVRGQGGQQRRP